MEAISAWIGRLPVSPTVAVAVVSSAILAVMLSWPSSRSTGKQPPVLRGTIPYVSNTVRYLTNAGAFLDRVCDQLEKTKSNIIKFHVGFTPRCIVTGVSNVQKVLAMSPEVLDVNFLMLRMMEAHWGVSPTELGKFANDHSGRGKVPFPGTEHTPDDKRYWHGHDRLYIDFLTNRKHSDALAETFYRLFSERLGKLHPHVGGEWATVNLFEFLKANMAESAIVSMFGSRLVELNPGLIEAYWDFDTIAGHLAWGLPNFLQRRPLAIKARLHEMTRKHIDSAWEHFDWNGPDAKATWDPHWGSQLSRESARWLCQGGFSDHATAGHTLATLFGLNGNTVSSLYVEIMRLHVSLNITRQAKQALELDGYAIEKGALVQTCSQVAHYDEAVWAVDGHPASEFWAWRHVKEVEVADEEGSGGGFVMCPGRHFAKQQILLVVAVLVTKFDIELVEWTNHDGSASDRPALDDRRYAGFVAMSPDREMKIRWRRRW
ncbi:cytochrome P450 [Cercophora scortea]|uniref:Cytochrome P450 n=1 Tax=Cercophora scortea TaxID=314031 RepID=A0AAE0INW7_9PEZI|nr:cytochrome P450 [Cercophora scortea]